MRHIDWASDVPISMPEPPSTKTPVLVDMGGYGFTVLGLTHNLTTADVEELSTPFFSPDGAQP